MQIIDDIVEQIRFPNWQNTAASERELHALLKAKDLASAISSA